MHIYMWVMCRSFHCQLQGAIKKGHRKTLQRPFLVPRIEWGRILLMHRQDVGLELTRVRTGLYEWNLAQVYRPDDIR